MVTILLVVLMVNTIGINVYCRLQEYIDEQKRRQDECNTKLKEKNDEDNKPSRVKIMYRWINAYLYGYTLANIIFVGKIPSHRVRKILYKYVFRMKLSHKTIIYRGAEIRSPWNIHLGACTIAANCILDGRSGIEIGDNVVLGSGVHIWTQEHDLNDPWFRVLSHNRLPVKISNYAWVCSDVILLPGVNIEEGAVVAARACVTKDCEAYGVYAGIPAKKISNRNKELRYKLNGKSLWHFL